MIAKKFRFAGMITSILVSLPCSQVAGDELRATSDQL